MYTSLLYFIILVTLYIKLVGKENKLHTSILLLRYRRVICTLKKILCVICTQLSKQKMLVGNLFSFQTILICKVTQNNKNTTNKLVYNFFITRDPFASLSAMLNKLIFLRLLWTSSMYTVFRILMELYIILYSDGPDSHNNNVLT